MSQYNFTQADEQRFDHFLARHHDAIPIAIIALMSFAFLLYWRAPVDSWRITLGREYLMPISNLLLFLYFLLSQIAPTIAKHLRERQLYIAESIKSFDLRSNEIALHYREIKEKLGRADVESEDIIQKANEIAEQTKQKIVANAKKQAARLEKDAESELDQKLRYTQQQLQLELIDAAFSKAEQLIEQHITSEDLQRFEQEYLKQVGKFS